MHVVTFNAVDSYTNEMHAHSLYYIIILNWKLLQLYYTYGSTYSRNGPNVPYMQYKMFTFIKLQ